MDVEKLKRYVWANADTVPGRSPDTWRRDAFGRLIRRGSFETRGRFAWVIDHGGAATGRGPDRPSKCEALNTVTVQEKNVFIMNPRAPGTTEPSSRPTATLPRQLATRLPKASRVLRVRKIQNREASAWWRI
jgi:hypothetical protein